MAEQPKSRQFISSLYGFLSNKGVMGNMSEDEFITSMRDKDFANDAFNLMAERNLLKGKGASDFNTFYRPFQDFYAGEQKKSQAEIQAGLGGASQIVSPLSSGVDFTAPIQDVARRTADIAAEQRQRQAPIPPPAPMAPRTFAGREIPAPVAPGREEQELVRQDVAAMQQAQANQLAQQRAQPIVQGREVFGQVQSDFPIKSSETAIKELEQARRERQATKERPALFQADKNIPTYGKFFENTRIGKVLSQGGEMALGTIKGIGAGALNIPELMANTMENIAVDIASQPLRKKLKEGSITQEQFNAYKKSTREAFKKAETAIPFGTPRKLEYLMDTYANADELEDAARKNLKEIQLRIDNADKGFEGLAREGRYADAFQYATTQAIGSLPYALTAALPGGVYVVGGVAAQDKYRQIEDEIGAENMRSAETLNAIGTGVVEGLSEAVTARLVKSAGALIRGVGKAAASKTIAQQAKSLIKATGVSIAEEALSEFGAQLAENVIDKATINPDKNISDGLIDALAIGAVSGGGITGVAGTIGLGARAAAGTPGAQPTPETGAEPMAPEAQAPTTTTRRAFGPLGESAPDAQVYADEILGNYRPEGGQLSAQEANGMVDDYLVTLFERDEQGQLAQPKPGTWEAEVYADVENRRDEITQALVAMAATPKPTRAERMAAPAQEAPSGEQRPTRVREQTPIETFANEIYGIFGGRELSLEQADKLIDQFLESLTYENESGETVYGTGYQEVLMNGDKIAEKIVELSKQEANAPQEIQDVQPQGGEQQPVGAQEGQQVQVTGQEAQSGTDVGNIVGNIPPSGGVQAEAVAGTPPVEEAAQPITKAATEAAPAEPITPTEPVAETQAEVAAAPEPIATETEAAPVEAIAPTEPATAPTEPVAVTQPAPTIGMPAIDLINDRGIFTINSFGFQGLQDKGDKDRVSKEGAGIDKDIRLSGPSERIVNNKEQVWERWRNPDRPLLYLMKDSGKTYMVVAMGWMQYGDESGRDGTVFGSIEYKEGMGNDVKRALLDETYKRYLDANSLTQVGNRTRFLRAKRGGQYQDYKRVYDPNMPLSDIDLTGTYQLDAFEGGAQPSATTPAAIAPVEAVQEMAAEPTVAPTPVQQVTAPVSPQAAQSGTVANPHINQRGVFLDSIANPEYFESFFGLTPEQKAKLPEQLKIVKRLQKIANRLGVKIYLGPRSSFSENVKGFADVDVKATKSTINSIERSVYVNFEDATPNTLAHELAHAFFTLQYTRLQSPQAIIDLHRNVKIEGGKLKDRLVAILNSTKDADLKALSKEIIEWSNGYDTQERGQEYVVELAARLSEGLRDKIIDNSVLAKIERAINAMFDALLGKDQLQIRLTDATDLIDFLNTLSRGVVDGDEKSIEQALELYESGRVTNPRRTVYWKKQEIKNGDAFKRRLIDKINNQKDFDAVKDIESIVNKILAQVFSPGKYIVKFNSAKDAAGFVENLNIGATHLKNPIKINKAVAADMMVAINDYIDTVITKKQQIGLDLTPEENTDLLDFNKSFPPANGNPVEPTAEEVKAIERLEKAQAKSKEVFGKMIDTVTVSPVANQDIIAGKSNNAKARIIQGRTGVVPNGLAGELAVSDSPHGLYSVFETALSKIFAIQRDSVTPLDAAKAIFAQAFDGKAVHGFAMFDKVRVLDPALVATHKEGGKEYYMFDGSGAASLLLNSELGQAFLQDLSEGNRNAEFEAQAAEIIELYGIDPAQFFDRVYDAQNAFNTGGITAAQKSLNNNRSLTAAIVGLGTLNNQESLALEQAIANDTPMRVRSTGNARLDSRADAMALALNMDQGIAREMLYQLVGKHLTSPLDQNMVDDAIDLTDMEFYPQLSMLTDSEFDSGFEILSYQRTGTANMSRYTSLPFYDAAKDYVMNELTKGTKDLDIVSALSSMYPAHLSGFDGKDFFEGVTARPYRSMTGYEDVSAAVFRLLRHLYRMEWGDAKMVLAGSKAFWRDQAYDVDYVMGNDLAPVRKMQRDVEKALGGLLPKESAAYQKMQLYVSASSSKMDNFTTRFYGDRKAMREKGFTDSFISRLTRSGVKSVNEFNTFLVNMHRLERISRAIDIQEKFLVKMYEQIEKIATSYNIPIQPITGALDLGVIMADVQAIEDYMRVNNIQDPPKYMKLRRFKEEVAQLQQAIALRDSPDGIIDRFRQYVKSKGINSAGLFPQNLETMPEFADHFQFLNEFKAFQNEYLDVLLDAGHLSDERYNHLKNGTSSESDVVWNYYTPLIYDEFAFRDEMGFPITSAERKVATFKIFGISLLRRKRATTPSVLTKKPITIGMLDLSNLESPLEVFFHRMSSAIKFRERNDAINSLANMLEQTGSDKYANFPARKSTQKSRWGSITSGFDLIPDSVKKQSVTYYKNGQRRYLYFADPNDPMLLKLNKGFDDFTALDQVFRHINNFARAAYTYLNPGFIEAQIFRDVVEATTNLAVESRGLELNNFKAKLFKGFTKNYAKSGKFFASPMFKKDPVITGYYREIMELGGFMSWSFNSMELLQDASDKVKDNIAYAEQFAQGRTSLEKAKTRFKGSIKFIEDVSNAIEMTPRLATYITLREMGVEPIRAAEAAKNVTVNFEKKGAGKIIRQLSSLYLFLAPSIQGVRKTGKQIYSPDGRKYLLAYAAAAAAARGLLYMVPYLAGDDEEEKENISNKVDRYVYDKWASDTKVLFPNIFDPENPFTIPKPYGGFRIAAAIGEGMVDLHTGKKTAADIVDNVRNQIAGAMDPIAGTSSYFNNWVDAMPLPLLHPLFEAVANTDYQGRPILFDQSGAFDYLKANKNTAQVYHTIAQNVFRHTPGHIDISPTSYEHVIESYFKLGPARIVTNLGKAYNNLTDPESGKTDAERAKHFLKEVVSANRVLYNPNISEDDKRDLYNYLSMASAPMGSWNEEKVKYAERAIFVTKQKLLVNPKVIQDSLDNLLSQVVENGRLYQNVPGQDITWAQWYSAMSSIGDKRDAAQHKRYINDKILKILSDSGMREQE